MLNRRSLLLLGLTLPLFGAGVALGDVSRLNPNTASAAQLNGIAGLGSNLAAAIVAQRPFANMVEFDKLVRKILDQRKAEALYEQLFIPINLNSASRAEIALIPGMSSRMVREFLEYRPYSDIGVFNREIGKYVDDAEVARLRSYVTL
jgi:DNA uptake protein ComE-like DNA-binding protein